MALDIRTEGLSVNDDENGAQAMFTVVVESQSQSAVMKAATGLLEQVEGYDGANRPAGESDGARDDSDGENGPESDGTSEPGYDTIHGDGIVRIEFDGDRHGVRITPDTRIYQVLYHLRHYRALEGMNTFTTAEIVDRYDHLDAAEVTPSLSNLQRAAFIERQGTDDGAPVYRICGKALNYVDKHGEPEKYRLPE